MPEDEVELFASAMNTQDNLLPTSVKIEVFNAEETITIQNFSLEEGLGLGRLNSWYIGLTNNSHKTWKVNIEYTPPKIRLEDAECQFIVPSLEVAIDSINIVNKGDGKAEMEMGFLNASAPAIINTTGHVRCGFTGVNPENDMTATSRQEKLMFKTNESANSMVTPLFHYPSFPRFGRRDIGRAGWMRAQTIWYMAKNRHFVYNDASREHGGCFVKDAFYESYNKKGINCKFPIRDHNSHRDGTSVDILYPNGNGSTKDLRGWLKQASIDPTRAEQVKDWVTNVRAEIDRITSDEEVKEVYVSNQTWLSDLLNTGKDEEGSLVQGLSVWNTKSKKVFHYKSHNTHMHIELGKEPMRTVNIAIPS